MCISQMFTHFLISIVPTTEISTISLHIQLRARMNKLDFRVPFNHKIFYTLLKVLSATSLFHYQMILQTNSHYSFQTKSYLDSLLVYGNCISFCFKLYQDTQYRSTQKRCYLIFTLLFYLICLYRIEQEVLGFDKICILGQKKQGGDVSLIEVRQPLQAFILIRIQE